MKISVNQSDEASVKCINIVQREQFVSTVLQIAYNNEMRQCLCAPGTTVWKICNYIEGNRIPSVHNGLHLL